VLPVAVGQAARLIEYLDDAAKTYVADVQFGKETDTYDAEGEVVARGDASGLAQPRIERELGAFEGEIEQTPPKYSALKLAGKPLYRYAREGVDVDVRPRVVRIDSARLLRFDAAESRATIEVVCGKGTYIRSIAHDLGRALGCGAHLAGLRRTSSGGFDVEDAHTPDALVALAGRGELAAAILAPDRAAERRPAAIFGPAHAGDVRAGRNVGFEARAGREAGDLCRAYSVEGDFLGMLRLRVEGVWHPEKVLPTG
jgi:tRNA pseudouridine55 synthase